MFTDHFVIIIFLWSKRSIAKNCFLKTLVPIKTKGSKPTVGQTIHIRLRNTRDIPLSWLANKRITPVGYHIQPAGDCVRVVNLMYHWRRRVQRWWRNVVSKPENPWCRVTAPGHTLKFQFHTSVGRYWVITSVNDLWWLRFYLEKSKQFTETYTTLIFN